MTAAEPVLRLWHARVSYLLTEAGIDHLLIKGATWMPELRLTVDQTPADVDVLVAPERINAAVEALLRRGLPLDLPGVSASETSLHSTVVRAGDGPEVDVHRHYAGLDADPAAAWRMLYAEHHQMPISHRMVPVANLEAQVLIAAVSAARDGAGSRAAARIAQWQGDWASVATLARGLDAGGSLRAGLAVCGRVRDADSLALPSIPVRWQVRSHSGGAYRLAEILAESPRRAMRVIMREIWPTRGFLQATRPGVRPAVARAQHMRRVFRELPKAIARLWLARSRPN